MVAVGTALHVQYEEVRCGSSRYIPARAAGKGQTRAAGRGQMW